MNRRSCPSLYATRVATGVTIQADKLSAGKSTSRAIVVMALLVVASPVAESQADPQTIPKADEPLKQLSLADLGNVEVTTASKEPESGWKTPAALVLHTP